MIRRAGFVVLAAVAVLLAADCARRPVAVTLVFTGRGDGTLAGCDCPGGVPGGLARRAALFRTVRDTARYPLFVDAGDFLSSYSNIRHDRSILDVMVRLGYDAVNAGDQDVRYGSRFLEKGTLPLVNAGMSMDGPSGPAPWAAAVTRRMGGAEVLITGITDKESFYLFPADSVPGLIFNDLYPALERITGENGNEKLVIVLSQLGFDRDTVLARQIPGIDVIVEGHKGPETPAPVRIGNTLVVCAAPGGDRVGMLRLPVDGGDGVSLFFADLDTAVVPDPEIGALIRSARHP